MKRASDFLRSNASNHRRSSTNHYLLAPWRCWKRLTKRSNRHKLRGPVFFVLWAVWLLVGTLFYAYVPGSELGFVQGWYMAVNIGYSVGFGFPTEQQDTILIFSSLYVLVGSSFVAVALGFFAEKIAEDTESWFSRLQEEQQDRRTLWVIVRQKSASLKAVGVWLLMILLMIIYTMVQVQWSFLQAQYYAISTLSTGGHWAIPSDSPTWLFGLTAFFCMIGVPVMAVAMAQIARGLMDHGSLDETKSKINEAVSKDELVLLHDLLGLESDAEVGHGEIDRAAFIILCMMRMGTDPALIEFITKRFDELNFYTGESLTVAEISQGKCKMYEGRIRRTESIKVASQLKAVNESEALVRHMARRGTDLYTARGVERPDFHDSALSAIEKFAAVREECSMSDSSRRDPHSDHPMEDGSLGHFFDLGGLNTIEEPPPGNDTNEQTQNDNLPCQPSPIDLPDIEQGSVSYDVDGHPQGLRHHDIPRAITDDLEKGELRDEDSPQDVQVNGDLSHRSLPRVFSFFQSRRQTNVVEIDPA